MSTFEWAVLAFILLGMVLPVWVFFAAALMAAKRPKQFEPSARFFAYSKLLQSLHDQMDEETGTVKLGPLWVATVRELQGYDEFSDLSLLYLEEIEVTGAKKFDQVMKNEMKIVEAHLLKARQRRADSIVSLPDVSV